MSLARARGLLVLGLMGLAACDEVSFPVLGGEGFQATLSGANEVPAVTTTASGTAVFSVVFDSLLIYRLDVVGIDTPTVAHIHQGAAGAPGPVIVTLYGGPTRNTAGYTGPLGVGQLRPAQLTQLPAGFGADARARFDSLLSLMRAGNVYVNVHTRRNPGGELRGQIQLR
ncbi:MAG TPA: CHRD domain-containing protein [Gemmatimonadales bacterium]|nr:CHRD domain-containing protein [Gemmatimonadales bacterium]